MMDDDDDDDTIPSFTHPSTEMAKEHQALHATLSTAIPRRASTGRGVL